MDGTNMFYVVLLASLIYVHGQEEKKGQLVRSLLEQYDKSGGKLVIPDNNGAVNVSHNIALRRIISLEKQVLTIDAVVSTRWMDNRLTWDPDVHNVTAISLPAQYIWQPDIMLYNNADENNGIHNGDTNMVINYDGTVFNFSPVKFRSFCKMRSSLLKRKQKVKCHMKFGSWTHDGLCLDLFNEHDKIDLSEYDSTFNRKWKIVSATAKRNRIVYSCCPEPYVDLLYTLTLKHTGKDV